MGCDVASKAAADHVHARQRLRIQKSFKRAAECLDVVKRRGLARDNVISFGAQGAQLPAGEVLGVQARARRRMHLKKWALVLHAGPMNTTASFVLGPPLWYRHSCSGHFNKK